MNTKNIAIVVDSACNLSEKKLRDNNIFMVPLTITFNDNEQIPDLEELIIKNGFYERLKMKEEIKTSQSIVGDILNKWDKLLADGYKEIIFIPIAKSLSGQYQTTFQLSKEEKYKGKVHIFDIDSAATLTSVIALKAQEMVENGGNVEEIESMAKKYKKNSHIYIIPEDIQRLAKGGRAKKAIITLITLIKKHVIIEQTTTSEKKGFHRTLTSAIEECIKNIKILLHKSSEYVFEILMSQCNDNIKKIIDKIIENNYEFTIKKTNLPNVFSSHAGINSISIIAVKKD